MSLKFLLLGLSLFILFFYLPPKTLAVSLTFSEFDLPSANSNPYGINTGTDGNLWFTEISANKIGSITSSGVITEFNLTIANSQPRIITSGPDGNSWFTENNVNRIGKITSSGVITEFTLPTGSRSDYITSGPDGNLWFTEGLVNKIGRITPSGIVTEFTTPSPNTTKWGITSGPDGNLWYVQNNTSGDNVDKIGRITPSGEITEFPIPTLNSNPVGITLGSDGNLWFAEDISAAGGTIDKIGRITPGGVITEFPFTMTNRRPINLTLGPDGNVWFTAYEAHIIGSITPSGVITEYPISAPDSFPAGITSAPDGNIWFTDRDRSKIMRANLETASPTPTILPSPTPTPTLFPTPTPSPTLIPTLTPAPTPTVQLGGLNLNDYCESLGQTEVNLNGNIWSCQPSGTQVDMNKACQEQYNSPTATAKQLDPNNPYTWQCFDSPTPTPTPVGNLVGTFDGFKLYDDGVDSSPVVCPDRTANSSGIHLQQNGRFTDLRWNGYTIATIDPGDNPAVSIKGVAINESSEVVAQLYNSDRPTSLNSTAIFWKGGVTTVLADTSSSGAFAAVSDINNKGYDIGYISSDGGLFGKESSFDGGDLGRIGTGYVFPRCIDENNVITGDALDFPAFATHHVHWVSVTPPTDKNPLVPFVAEYFDNQNLAGTPKITRLDSKINFATDGSVDSSLPPDHFSVRWTKTQFMKAGRYSFTLKSDDGIRLWVDNTLVVDDWTDHPMRVYTPDILVQDGNHSFKVEYYENAGGAVAIFNEDFPARNLGTPISIPNTLLTGAALSKYIKPIPQNCNINIPSQYNTIQAGINAANNGDTICVKAGTYNEDLSINKSIRLSGEGTLNTIINGQNPNASGTVYITAKNVILEGFLIHGIGNNRGNSAVRQFEQVSNSIVQYNDIVAGNGQLAFLTDNAQKNNLVQNNILEGNNSPNVALVNAFDSNKPTNKVDFLNNTFIGTASPSSFITDTFALDDGAPNSLIKRNVFNTTGTMNALISSNNTSKVNENNLNSNSVTIKVRGTTPLNAKYNWWGDTDPSDNVQSGVNFVPFATTEFAIN